MEDDVLELAASLDALRSQLEAAAEEAGAELDFLMHKWNGRFATYNVGRPTEEEPDARRGVGDEARRYKLIGRVKATTHQHGVRVVLRSPTACDPTPTPEDVALWARFVQALRERLREIEQA